MSDTHDTLPISTAAVRPSRGAPPAAIRELREACGWTPEQMAQALGVMPVEVAAWEAGTVEPPGGTLRWMRWHARNAELDRSLRDAGAAPCAWIVENRERLALKAGSSSYDAWFVRRELRAHRTGCAECRQVQALTGHPPVVPDLPSPPGLGALRARMDFAIEPPPWWQRLLFRGVRMSVVLLGILVLSGIWEFAEKPSAGFEVPLGLFLPLFVIFAVLGLVNDWVIEWDDEFPVLAAHTRVAAAATPVVLLATAYSESATLAETWWLIPAATLALGWMLARQAEEAAPAS